MKIAIDIGHARNTGTSINGLEEHAVAKEIALSLAVILDEAGHETDLIDFPAKSNSDDLNATIKAANAGRFDFGISIHCDCSNNKDARGAHVCYLTSTGKRLADAIAGRLCRLMPGRSEQTVKRANLAVLKQTKPVWVLCECGFISNAGDASIMAGAPNSIAQQIAFGVQDYVSASGRH